MNIDIRRKSTAMTTTAIAHATKARTIVGGKFHEAIDRTLAHLRIAKDQKMASDFLTDADAIETGVVPVGAQALLYVIGCIVVFGILWSVFGKVDKTVSAPGRVVTGKPLVALQAYSASRIFGILVSLGDHVTKGQVLARFDPTFAKADVQSLKIKDRSLTAEISRIEAELAGSTFSGGDGAERELQEQAKIFDDQMTRYQAQMAIWKSRSDGIDANLAANRTGISGLRTQLGMADKVVEIRKTLVAQKAGASMDVMIAESSRIDAEMRLKSLIGDSQKLLAQRAENEANRVDFVNKWKEDLAQRLATARAELATTKEGLNKASGMSSLSELRSPMSGTVLEISAGRSVGSVLREGETLATLVPDNSELLIEANVAPRDVGNLKIGQAVRVKLDAYPYQTYGTLNGHLKIIGADSLSDQTDTRTEGSSQPSYRARVVLDDRPDVLARRGIHIRPGITARVDIQTGRRSIASYIFEPILGVADESMREP